MRAQAGSRDGSLVDDFRVSRQGRMTAIRNAPSPAATSSMAIAEHLAGVLFDGGADPSGWHRQAEGQNADLGLARAPAG